MKLSTFALFAALAAMVSDTSAEEAKPASAIGSVVDAFSAVCLPGLPAFPKDGTGFAIHGYDTAFKEPGMFTSASGGFAGIGYAGMEGGARNSNQPNGCLVYVRGLDADAAAQPFDKAMSRKFKLLEKKVIGKDHYWIVRDFAPRRFIAVVAPKSEGTYAGHTLLMITEQKVDAAEAQKKQQLDPKLQKDAARQIEELKKMPPEDRIAYFASQQFAQCLLATNYMEIAFDKEVGVQRVQSNTPGQNQFLDSTTGNAIMTTAKDCIVAFQGTNIALALEGIKPILSLRDKNPQGTAFDQGYLIKLNMEGKPHIVQIARAKIQGRDYVRMILAEDPPKKN